LAAFCYGLWGAGPTYFSGGGFKVESLAYDVWEAFLCSGLCIGLLVLFRERVQFHGELARNLGNSTYAVYLFHVPVLVFLQYAILNTGMAAIIKFLVVTLGAVPLTFLLCNYFRRIPMVNRVL
jgi:glucan biosynthesis protein C